MALRASKDRAAQARQLIHAREGAAVSGARCRLLPTRVPTMYLAGAIIFALVAASPLLLGIAPLPYTLGQITPSDAISRVEFERPESAGLRQTLQSISDNYPHRYSRIYTQLTWRRQMESPLTELITTAQRTKDLAVLLKTPAAKKAGLTKKSAAIFLRGIQKTQSTRNPLYWVRNPPMEYMQQYIYPRGVMLKADFERERGREIQILTPAWAPDKVTVTPRPTGQGPVIKEWLKDLLDQRFETVMDSYDQEFRFVLRDIVQATVQPSLRFDKTGTEAAIEVQKKLLREEKTRVKVDSVMVLKGQPISGDILDLLRAEAEAFRQTRGIDHIIRQNGAKAVLILILAFCFIFVYGRLCREQWQQSREMLGVFCLACGLVALGNLSIYLSLPASVLPVGLLAGVAALLVGAPVAAIATTVLSLVFLVLLEGNAGVISAHLISGLVFAYCVPKISRRHQFLSLALGCGCLAGFLVITWGVALGEGPAFTWRWREWLDPEKGSYLYIQGVGALVSWFVAGAGTLFSLPIVESVFQRTTAVRLQELQDQNHPCLKQMVVEAPGTYHHSILVSTLAEAAAESIGADALLVKVGAYYHDIGKLIKPEYFAENESGASRHDSLSPTMSTLIIIAHVKDGAEMAREYGLPPAIVDIIQEHHGRDLIRFFYHKAKRQASEESQVSIADFRYPGPSPQSRETGIMMFADSAEAACRALDNPTAAHIRKLVHAILMDRLLDGQFSESGLTLSELHTVEETLIRILISMHHGRVKYPGQERGRRGKR